MMQAYIFQELQLYFKYVVNNRIIALWGMGMLGKEFICQSRMPNIEKEYPVQIECFDSNKREYKTIDSIKDQTTKYFVIVCFFETNDEIKEKLKSMGYVEDKDFVCLGKFSRILNHPRIPEYVYDNTKLPFPSNSNVELNILGNGPSLKETLKNNLEVLTKNDCMVVNSIAQSDYYELIMPKYYTILEPSYWNTSLLSDEIRNLWKKDINSIVKKTSWDMVFFVPVWPNLNSNAETIDCLKENHHIKFVYVYANSLSGDMSDEERYRLYDDGMGIPFASNVLIFTVYLGIRLKYHTINLYGADHSWMNNLYYTNDGVLSISDVHFYDNNKVEGKPLRNDYIGRTFTSSEIFSIYSSIFKSYEELQQYAQYKGIQIYNKTPGSFIDAFQRR